jgi:hypothetical protein
LIVLEPAMLFSSSKLVRLLAVFLLLTTAIVHLQERSAAQFSLCQEQAPLGDADEFGEDHLPKVLSSPAASSGSSVKIHSATDLLVQSHLSAHFLESPLHALRNLRI